MLILSYYLTRKLDNPPVQVAMDELKLALFCQVKPHLGLSFSSSSQGLLVRKTGKRQKSSWEALQTMKDSMFTTCLQTLIWCWQISTQERWMDSAKASMKTSPKSPLQSGPGIPALPCPCTTPGCRRVTASRCCFQIEVCSSSSWPEQSWPSRLHVCSEAQICWLASALGWNGI